MILHLKIRARLSSVRNPSASLTSFGIIHPRALYIQNQPFVSRNLSKNSFSNPFLQLRTLLLANRVRSQLQSSRALCWGGQMVFMMAQYSKVLFAASEWLRKSLSSDFFFLPIKINVVSSYVILNRRDDRKIFWVASQSLPSSYLICQTRKPSEEIG